MEQKIALVTGGSGGLGEASVERLVADGFFVYFTYGENAQKAQEIESKFSNVKAIQYKHGETEASEVLKQIKTEQGKIDVLVNNLGITNDKLLATMKSDDFMNVIDVNLRSTFEFTKATVKMMSRKKCGKIINVSSVVGVSGNLGQANYSASKAGMIGFTKSVAKEYARKNINVNSISPGFVETAMTDKLSDEIKETACSHIDLNRFAKPEEIASVISFLASDDSSYISGQNIIVDGGMI